jgi:hypothetical protein
VRAVRCTGCGGTVRMIAGQDLPSCVFCGASAADLVPAEPPEGLEQPAEHLPFVVTDDDARARFRTFAGSSIWYPSDLRSARLELRRLYLPAWAWSGRLETHWTGLVRAGTRSGKAPTAGVEDTAFPQVLVPASSALRLAELTALGRWDESQLRAFDPEAADAPMELSEMTRSAAQAEVRREMERRESARITASHGLVQIHASCLATALEGRPVLVPVFVGAYRYGDRTFRVLVNGQSATFVGTAPVSPWKVLGAILLVLAVLGAVALAVSVCAGGGVLLGTVR